jgi:hypothetical protein
LADYLQWQFSSDKNSIGEYSIYKVIMPSTSAKNGTTDYTDATDF